MSLNGVEYYYIRNAQGDITGLFDGSGTQVVSYTYDSWGKLISIDGTLKDTVGAKNPYRYRGYRYDTETGLYYLQSRYYNPEWGRFINADAFAGQPGELLSHNMFEYCADNPINREDQSGKSWFPSIFKSVETVILEAITIITLAVIVSSPPILNPINTMSSTRDTSKEKVAPISIPIEKTKKKKEPTLIYRSASGTNKSLTPRPVDVGGLSFYLKRPATGKYVVTTVEAVNATRVLHANIDGINHCSVMPTNPLTMSDWIASRDNADTNPHPYTVILKSIVWDEK
jgi:RHS repeat-associated protein